jgi:hypothetical protein
MSVSSATKIILAVRSGNHCAYPDCTRTLATEDQGADPVVTGEVAHIAGLRPGAARYDPSMTEDQRNHYSNLIYLCGDHHTQIDKQVARFSVERLRQMKEDHERAVQRGTLEALAGVGFPELEEATQWIMQITPAKLSYDFSLVPLGEKLAKNDLNEESRSVVTMGLSVAADVQAFIESIAQTDSDFPERLKAGFLEEYFKWVRQGYRGDDLFDLMCAFAQRGFTKQSQRSAGLAVLVCLFESCEVFEK